MKILTNYILLKMSAQFVSQTILGSSVIKNWFITWSLIMGPCYPTLHSSDNSSSSFPDPILPDSFPYHLLYRYECEFIKTKLETLSISKRKGKWNLLWPSTTMLTMMIPILVFGISPQSVRINLLIKHNTHNAEGLQSL